MIISICIYIWMNELDVLLFHSLGFSSQIDVENVLFYTASYQAMILNLVLNYAFNQYRSGIH